MKHRTLWIVLIAMATLGLGCALAGCGGKEKAEPTPLPVAQATPSPTEQPTRPSEPKATPTPVPPTPRPPTPTPLPPTPMALAGLFVRPQEVLDSYRLRSTVRILEGGGLPGEEFTIEEEWVRQPPARRQATSFRKRSTSRSTPFTS
ncbi:MAG: hypothetical protein QHJ81_14130 [Anaerolineae bacterium]|nr:hypothetical protein [Anaerolineae bacterium]